MEETIQKFYEAFNNLDAETMVNLYHEDIVFEDPAFGILHGDHAKNMWRMLCHSQKGKPFSISVSNILASEEIGRAHWEAKYTYGEAKRPVHNKIDAHFEFKDGKIIKHTDIFNLYAWCRQALGPVGTLLGWSPFFRERMRKKVFGALRRFELKRQELE